MTTRSRQRGFTLIEIVVVVAILGILASVALPVMDLIHAREREASLQRSLREIRSALDAYKRAADDGFIARSFDASGYPPDLETLVTGVENQRDPARRKLYFLRRLPADPMAGLTAGASLEAAAATWATRSYASPPDDPRPGADVFDIASRSERRGLNGVAYSRW